MTSSASMTTLPAGAGAAEFAAEVTATAASLRTFLHGLPGVDKVGADQRAATLATRSIKTTAKQWALDLAIRLVALTTLEGADTPGKVRALCAKAMRPDPADRSCPPAAAVCVYPALVPTAVETVRGSSVRVASVATACPSGQVPLSVKLDDVAAAVAAGADEVDMVIDRGAFLSGRYDEVFRQIVAVKEACGSAHLKVILETAELPTYAHVRHASQLAIDAGADWIKTSTGKATTGATPGVVLVMLETVRDHHARTGQVIGVKAAGGVSTTKAALHMLVLVKETLGDEWLIAERFRIGASSLLNDLLMQYAKLDGGHYGRAEDFSKE
jgi:deoxyribose-phosphate aldolase